MSKSEKLTSPTTVYNALFGYANKRQEHFLSLTLNAQHKIINIHVISIGTVNKTITHPRDVFYSAIQDNAVALIIAHNHPSGGLTPSMEDKAITTRLLKGADIIGIQILDHIIISKEGYYSFLESGEL